MAQIRPNVNYSIFNLAQEKHNHDDINYKYSAGVPHGLKGLAQAKIIKKSVILFWLFNMTIWCKHVHRQELKSF